jgi:outer membrane protein assembly factor BamB
MSLLLHRRFLSALVLLVVVLDGTVPHAAGQPVPASAVWARAWPMVGHDPQQTARGASVGPLRPHLLWSYRGLQGPPIVGPDGSVYAWTRGGIVALTAAGRRRWMVPAEEFLGGPPALGSDGLVRVNGELSAMSGTLPPGSAPHMAIFALAPTGRRLWTIRALPWATMPPQSVPFSKGAAPLVTAANMLYVPFGGPAVQPGANLGVEVITPAGVPLRRLLAGWAGTIAVARDGTVYEIGGDLQGHTAVLASRTDDVLWWSHPVTYDQYGAVLVGHQSTIYASDGTGFGQADAGEIIAYSASGRLLWRLRTAGVAALAERADGTGVSAISLRGRSLWRHALGHAPATVNALPSLVVDARGRVYVGTGDGLVRTLAPNGTLLWTLRAGGPTRIGASPALALGPDGALLIVGTDAVLRLYR